MSFFDKLRAQKLLSFTLILFTLSIGIVIGTVINSGVKAAKDSTVAPGATPLTIPSPVELSTTFSQIAKSVEPSVVNISTTYRPKAPVQARSGRRQAAPPDDDQGDQGEENFLYRSSAATRLVVARTAPTCRSVRARRWDRAWW